MGTVIPAQVARRCEAVNALSATHGRHPVGGS
jgi:hypothetical protein